MSRRSLVTRASRMTAALLLASLFGGLTSLHARGASAEPIKIGFSVPLTGPLASIGKAVLGAYRMWMEGINARGGLLGRQVQLDYYDDQSNPSLVPGTYRRLLDKDRVDLVLSSYGTNLTAPALPVVAARHFVFMGLFALDINKKPRYPYYFSMFPAGPDAIHEFSRGFFELGRDLQPKAETVAVIGSDTDFAETAAEGAHDNALEMGFRIVYERGYPANTLNFMPILRAVQAANPDLIYVASYPTDSLGIVRAASEMGIKAKLFGGGMVGLQYASLKTELGPKLNGIVNFDFYVPEPTVPFHGIAAFLRRYQRRAAGKDYDPLGFFVPPFAYANLQVLGQAVAAVRSLDQRKLGEYLRTHRFPTIVGELRYAPNGEWANSRVLQIQFQGVRDNGLDQFKRSGTQVIVYPKELASGTLQVPYSASGR